MEEISTFPLVVNCTWQPRSEELIESDRGALIKFPLEHLAQNDVRASCGSMASLDPKSALESPTLHRQTIAKLIWPATSDTRFYRSMIDALTIQICSKTSSIA